MKKAILVALCALTCTASAQSYFYLLCTEDGNRQTNIYDWFVNPPEAGSITIETNYSPVKGDFDDVQMTMYCRAVFDHGLQQLISPWMAQTVHIDGETGDVSWGPLEETWEDNINTGLGELILCHAEWFKGHFSATATKTWALDTVFAVASRNWEYVVTDATTAYYYSGLLADLEQLPLAD